MNALEPLRIEEAAGIADDEAAVGISARHGVPAAIGQRLRTVTNKLAALEEFLVERAASAFGEDGDFRAKLIARREVVFGLAVLVDALVFGDDTGDAVALVNEFGTAKFLEDVDASGFDKAAEPFGDSAQRDNIVPLVLKRWRRDGKTQGGT